MSACMLSLHGLPSFLALQLFPLLIGREGSKKRALEQKTGAFLTFPPRGERQAQEIVVRGPSTEAVAMARARIQQTIQAAQARKPAFTHFISMPLAPLLPVARFVDEFGPSVLADPRAGPSGMHSSVRAA
jgi:hypothetical protein